MVRITFKDFTVKPHITLANLAPTVTQDIETRYSYEVSKTTNEKVVTLDPGGMARFGEHIKWATFEYNGITFRCQDIHIPGVLILLDKAKLVETPVGNLVRIYFEYDVLVVPPEWWFAICAGFRCEEELGRQARQELQAALSGVIAFKGK
jgi:hypothetical protein